MRVFMLGWEFPPYISGGLGTACYGLTKAMSAMGTDIIFVLPRPIAPAPVAPVEIADAPKESDSTTDSESGSPANLESESISVPQSPGDSVKAPAKPQFQPNEFKHVTFRSVAAQLADPYQTAHHYQEHHVSYASADSGPAGAAQPILEPLEIKHTETPAAPIAPKPAADVHYGTDLFTEIQRYANLASEIARQEEFDVVHAHDWMTFPAGMAVAAVKGVPLVVHVHSTEFDRSGVHIDTRIFDIERRGMNAAMKIIAVSYLTKNQITHHYGVDPTKIEVVYNAIETDNAEDFDPETYRIHTDEKIVLFLGRITQQKGPEYFLGAAKKVLEVMDNVKFVMAGSGDLTRRTIEMAAEMGIGHKVLFTGFLRGPDVERVFKMADLYVMPSVSEPFGIAPLEAMSHDVPVLISKQSGVSEVLAHALKVDFWDTTEMANKIVAVLKHPPLASTLREHGSIEVRQLSWADAAQACSDIYDEAQAMVVGTS